MGGAVIGVCPVCKDFIYESVEWTIDRFFMKHWECDYSLMEDIVLKLPRLTREQKIRIFNFLDSIIEKE